MGTEHLIYLCAIKSSRERRDRSAVPYTNVDGVVFLEWLPSCVLQWNSQKGSGDVVSAVCVLRDR